MRISVERLRIGLLVGAGLLVVVIAAFLGYARYRVRRGIANLPGKLGATITSESNGYTYSQSDGKKTVFTIHAAKAVQHNDGKYTLHDVNMILYGHKGDRADRISGSEFEYDTKAEVIRAMGVVHIDLEAPVAKGTRESEASKHLDATGVPAGVNEEAGVGSRVIHVTTSGLVYVKSLATAATDQGLDFAFGGYTGHAVGAEYNSDSGHLVLQTAVTVSGLAGRKNGGKPIALAASHGELDRESDGQKNSADFKNARYSSAGEVAQAEMAHLYMRTDGTVERIEGVGQVVIEDAGKGRATSDRADVMLDATNKPKTAVLAGNVKFNDDEAFRQTRGDSKTADLSFDGQGRIDHAVLRGGVHTYERVRAADDAKAPWSERTLTADTVDLALVTDAAGKAELRDAKATGSARLKSVSTVLAGTATEKTAGAGTKSAGTKKAGTKKAGTTTTNLAADELRAHFVDARGEAELSTVHGAGHTVLEQSAPGGIEQTSRSETLDVRFRETGDKKGAVEIAEAVQEGGVVIDRTAPAKTGPAKTGKDGAMAVPVKETQHRVAGRAAYDAESDKVTLTDGVEISDTTSEGTSTIWAAKVVTDLESGDATAEGGVKVTYLQAGAAQPVHVLAARAELEHDAGRATFYGRGGPGVAGESAARMWQVGTEGQGGSQIEAPVLMFEQETNRLTARAERPGVLGTVHTVLISAPSARPPGAAAKPKAKASDRTSDETSAKLTSKQGLKPTRKAGEPQPPVRITSSELVYSDEGRQAVFSGGVRVVDGDGEMRAREATVFLKPAASKAEGSPPKAPGAKAQGGGDGMLGGEVDRIVATRGIELTQPGRLATGERLVYTASDQMFVLTGTASAPPKVVDDEQGTTTGAMLRFYSDDDSVSVLGSDGSLPARKVHSETYTKAGAKQK
jgi:lipopolysaccharide export system protein LptA